MSINPLKQIMMFCQNDSDASQVKEPSSNDVSRLEEASFFVNLFRVRAEDVAPFLWGKFYKEQQKRRERKMRRVNKKRSCSKAVLHKRQHEPDDQENRRCDYI